MWLGIFSFSTSAVPNQQSTYYNIRYISHVNSTADLLVQILLRHKRDPDGSQDPSYQSACVASNSQQ